MTPSKLPMFLIAGGIVCWDVAGVAAMAPKVLDAKIFDTRVTRCGVSIESGDVTTITPFLDSPVGLTGSMKIMVKSHSGSNTNMSMQTIRFPGNSVIRLSKPTSLHIDLSAVADGKEVCTLSQDVEFDAIRT